MKVESTGPDHPPGLKGIDLHVVDDDDPVVAVFAAYVTASHQSPGGDMKLYLGIPFPQIPRVMPIMQYIGGIQFEVTIRRVPVDELPGPGW